MGSQAATSPPLAQPAQGRECSLAAQEAGSGLWSGVSGVPGLGVSIPRPHQSLLEEWDRHDHCDNRSSHRRRSEVVGGRVELPRVLSPRSSSCRSSGRSTGSQGSSSAITSGGSSGGSAKYSSQSRRSDSGFSGGGGGPGSRSSGRSRGDQSQSKALSSSGRSSRREGGRHRGRRGVENPHHGPSSLPPPPCECVCTCGDPVPPKPVRRGMFSDESCSCSDDEKVKSLPVHMSSDSSTRGMGRGGSERLCCGPPSLPSRGQSVRMLKEEERRELSVKEEEMEEIRRNDEESTGCCSASPVPSHYKSPKEVDGDYSYAYSDSVSPAFLIRVGAAMEYSGSEEEVDEAKENIYEEIREKAEDNQLHNQQNQTDSRKSSTSSHEVSITSSTGTTKSRFQKALEAVTRRSSRSLEHNNNSNNNNSNNNNNNRERSFHLSISKGRKKNLI